MTLNRLKLLLIVGIVLIVGIISLIIIGSKSKPLIVISSTPTDQAKNIPLDSQIAITFNKTPKKAQVRFTIQPKAEGEVEISNNTYIFKPNSQLSKSTSYLVTLGLLDQKPTGVHAFIFQTEGPELDIPSTREAEDFEQKQLDFQRENSPDVFLVNKVPYSEAGFSITSSFTESPTQHFYFNVTLKGSDKNQSKESFQGWLGSLGLTSSQIDKLDIRYN